MNKSLLRRPFVTSFDYYPTAHVLIEQFELDPNRYWSICADSYTHYNYYPKKIWSNMGYLLSQRFHICQRCSKGIR